MSDNKFGFFKNKSDAGVTDPFVGYPNWPTMANTSFYGTFANNSTATANITYTRENSGAIANASFSTIQASMIPDSTGNVTIVDWNNVGSNMNAFIYDYRTSSVSVRTINLTDPIGGNPENTFSGSPWAANGNVHLLPRNQFAGSYKEIVFEYSPSANSMVGHYVGPAGGDWGFSDFLGADNLAVFSNGDVFCANSKNYQGGTGRTDQKYQMYYPATKTTANTGLSYPNDQIASGNISNDTPSIVLVDVTETNSSNVFFIPGLGCYKGAYGVPQANNNTSVIIEANVSTGVITEHQPANLTTAFNREGLGSGQIETIFSQAVYGADLCIYAFPGSSDIFNQPMTGRHQGIMKMDPTDIANATMSTYNIWDVSTEGIAYNSTRAFLGIDGFVHWEMTTRFNDDLNMSPRWICSLDTNPTSATYLTGFKQKISHLGTYTVTAFEGSSTSSSGNDEITISSSEDISRSSGVLTQAYFSGTTNADLTGYNGSGYYLVKIASNKYYMSPNSDGSSPVQSALGNEDPAGLTIKYGLADPTLSLNEGRTNGTAFSANGKMILGPVATTINVPELANNPLHVFNVSGSGLWKLQYGTWNRNNYDGNNIDD